MTYALTWKTRRTPVELRSMLRALADHFPVAEGGTEGVLVTFEPGADAGVCEVELHDTAAVIRYDAAAQAARGVGALLSGLVTSGRVYHEETPFRNLGIMLDCSRNAVMKPAHVEVWLRRLALLGYNMVMLYTEDTYALPGEPYFGYQRGAYTAAELKAIDRYAARLNIEVIPCIQTLGHLAQILRHPAYLPVKDTASVMLVDAEPTYALIEKMVGHWRKVCRTSRIHIGMDETHDLGRGRYMDMHGYKRNFDLFNAHLAKVVAICRQQKFEPMIWSDMYFRMGCVSGQYYDPATKIPADVVAQIPRDVELVYWDYYHENEDFYHDWIRRHRKMGKEPIVGSGIWTWNKYWYDHRLTEANAGACIAACRDARVKEIFFTQWGDNGAYCDHDSAFAGMTDCAERAYGGDQPSAKTLEQRFGAVCGGSYAAHILAGEMHGGIGDFQPNMWDDPFFETHVRTFCKDRPEAMEALGVGFRKLAGKLKPHAADTATGDLGQAWRTAQAFAVRYRFAAALLRGYRADDRPALRRLQRQVPRVRAAIEAMAGGFRAMWMRHNKPEGLETIQGRFGMLDARYREIEQRLGELLAGEITAIPELDCRCPPK